MEKLKKYAILGKAFVDHCYQQVEGLQWQYFITRDGGYKYYRTKLETLPVVVGFNIETQKYFLAIARVGDICNKPHRTFFPSKLQRLFSVLQQLQNNANYVQKGKIPIEDPEE